MNDTNKEMNQNTNVETNQEVVTSQTVTTTQAETTNEEPVMIEPNAVEKKKSKKGLIILLVILLLIIALGVVGHFIIFSPERMVKNNIRAGFESLKIGVKDYYDNKSKYDFDKESVGLKGDLTLSSDYKKDGLDLTKLKNYTINYDVVIDNPNNKMSAIFNVKRLNKDFINIKDYYNGKYSILDFGDMFNRTVKSDSKVDIKDLSVSAASEEDVITLIDRIEEFAVNHVSKDKVTKKIGNFEVNGNKKLFTRVNYEINDDKYIEDLNEFLKNDDKALDALVNITGDTKKELIDSFEDDSSVDDSSDNDVSSINFYYKILPIKYNYIEVSDKTDVFVFEPLKDKINITGYNDSKKELEAYYEYNTSKLFIDFNDTEEKSSMKIDMIVKEDNISGTINYTLDKETANITIDSKTTYRKNNDSKTEATIGFEYKGDGYEFDLTAKTNLEVKTNAVVTEVKEKNTITQDQFNETGYDAFSEKLMEKMMILLNDIAPDLLRELENQM